MRSPSRDQVFRLALLGCLLQYFGFHWDIVWHVVIGRDSFWLPPHLMVYFGVALVLASGALPIWSARGRAPLGCYVLALAATGELITAPIDDLWHRMFGINNTLWSPPHLAFILIGSTIPLGLILLLRSDRPIDLRNGSTIAPVDGHLRSSGAFASDLRLTWDPRSLLADRSLLLLGLFMACLDFTVTEFRLHLPPPIWNWEFALFPPIMIGMALLAGLAGVVSTRRVGAVTMVCLSFTALAVAVNLMLTLFFTVLIAVVGLPPAFHKLLPLQTVPLLLPTAVVADLLLARTDRLWPPLRFVAASLAFAAVFYAVQYPYTTYARPAWLPALVELSWLRTVALSLLAAAAGPLLGSWLRRASADVSPRPAPEPHLSPRPGESQVRVAG